MSLSEGDKQQHDFCMGLIKSNLTSVHAASIWGEALTLLIWRMIELQNKRQLIQLAVQKQT